MRARTPLETARRLSPIRLHRLRQLVKLRLRYATVDYLGRQLPALRNARGTPRDEKRRGRVQQQQVPLGSSISTLQERANNSRTHVPIAAFEIGECCELEWKILRLHRRSRECPILIKLRHRGLPEGRKFVQMGTGGGQSVVGHGS